MPAMLPPSACIAQAHQAYGVPAALIRSVIRIEHAGPGVVHHNRDGTDDLGWMQINTRWLSTLSAYGITRRVLLTDPCTNIAIGAWILRGNYLHYHDWHRAIHAYNASPGNPLGERYARKVIVTWNNLPLQPSTSEN